MISFGCENEKFPLILRDAAPARVGGWLRHKNELFMVDEKSAEP